MKEAERALRGAIIAQCRFLNASGLSQGASGNISARCGARMLITPSATPYDALEPTMLAATTLPSRPNRAAGPGVPDGRTPDWDTPVWEGPLKPSTEWRFHRDILHARPEVGAVVHAHPIYCTTLAVARKSIPAVHYMMAAFGGPNIRCSDYATFGTKALSDTALAALEGRNACLLANHGMITVGPTLEKAMWLALELETLARQYYLTLSIGGPVVLSDAQIAETAEKFADYGVRRRASGQDTSTEDASTEDAPNEVAPNEVASKNDADAGSDDAARPQHAATSARAASRERRRGGTLDEAAARRLAKAAVRAAAQSATVTRSRKAAADAETTPPARAKTPAKPKTAKRAPRGGPSV